MQGRVFCTKSSVGQSCFAQKILNSLAGHTWQKPTKMYYDHMSNTSIAEHRANIKMRKFTHILEQKHFDHHSDYENMNIRLISSISRHIHHPTKLVTQSSVETFIDGIIKDTEVSFNLNITKHKRKVTSAR